MRKLWHEYPKYHAKRIVWHASIFDVPAYLNIKTKVGVSKGEQIHAVKPAYKGIARNRIFFPDVGTFGLTYVLEIKVYILGTVNSFRKS
jgi:hypothetical protein